MPEPHWEISAQPPPGWDALAAAHGRLFQSRAWLQLLCDAFGARTLYAWNARASDAADADGAAITVFRAGPFRVGYLGFPVGGRLSGGALQAQDVAALAAARLPLRLDLLRLPVSGFSAAPPLDLPCAETPETAIPDLPGWDVAQAKKLVRDVKKAGRSECHIVAATSTAHADDMYRLYGDTVERHQGSLRYTRAYFRGLVALAPRCPAVRCSLAVCDEGIAAFAVVADDGGITYYLHAATNPAMKQSGASDLLLHAAIAAARDTGMRGFNLMSSPAGQPSLVRYKEKWGAVTATHRTYEMAVKPLGARLFRAATVVYRSIGRR